MIRIHKNSATYNLLKYLAIGSGVLLIGVLAPQAGANLISAAIEGYFRHKRFEKYRFLRDLKNLQSRELLDYKELADGRIRIVLTKSGRKKILSYRADEIALKQNKHWDGKWRLVIFDVPHENKRARDAFRQKLKDLKFYQLQKSVFITPYPCEDEIDFLAELYEVGNNVLILAVNDFRGQEKLKHYFGI